MRQAYQHDPIETGQWYVSEIPQIPQDGSPDYSGAHNARLRGPFPTKAEADDAADKLSEANPEYRTRLYTWQPQG